MRVVLPISKWSLLNLEKGNNISLVRSNILADYDGKEPQRTRAAYSPVSKPLGLAIDLLDKQQSQETASIQGVEYQNLSDIYSTSQFQKFTLVGQASSYAVVEKKKTTSTTIDLRQPKSNETWGQRARFLVEQGAASLENDWGTACFSELEAVNVALILVARRCRVSFDAKCRTCLTRYHTHALHYSLIRHSSYLLLRPYNTLIPLCLDLAPLSSCLPYAPS
ncbi:uncharacterized protein BDR25DRAFT_363350 [Lindgomyces ingoldianus]|uniref:Uncharacterized protein n=1 Tax=Lindgomyces ingoldianus TaxID=673940 RepID=A0ACB6Q9W5_9PLEO|nr:uncharacterized protein BDR25DRAFT_363350 [Lindgomyces ingoldianus]KAF2462936.1 hypothetical protein BDR25DRAFT_363350 [Lindgomyces ingoldianus]